MSPKAFYPDYISRAIDHRCPNKRRPDKRSRTLDAPPLRTPALLQAVVLSRFLYHTKEHLA